MLKDAQRAVDDLSAICRAVYAPDRPLIPVPAGVATRLAQTAAAELIGSLTAAAMFGVDVGAMVAEALRLEALERGIDVGADS